jgi:iron uptake system EfeUOB component EfeO/EfeM
MSRFRAAAVVGLLAVMALVGAALIPGSRSSSAGAARGPAGVAARQSGANTLRTHQNSVFGSNISARTYGTLIAEREQGIDSSGQLASDLDPISPRAFDRPIAAYRRYAERWAATLARDIGPLRRALRAGNRAAAQRAWTTAFADYLHLGAVYSLLPDELNDQLAEVPSSLGERRFAGLHRIEKGLWTGASPRSLLPATTALATAAGRLRRTLPSVAISPLDYATRAHEILEDAQRDLMSGSQVPWSQAGVLGTAAGVAVTREVIGTLAPLLQGRENALGASQNELARLQHVLNSVRLRDGDWPALTQLSQTQRELVDGSLAGTVGALSEVPGTLETRSVPLIPTIPAPK